MRQLIFVYFISVLTFYCWITFINFVYTNSKYCRFCIRHEIPKLIKENYLPGKVLEKINSHSYSGFVHYAQNYIISKYESICCIRNCYICND